MTSSSSNPFFSVIIPTYNRADFIGQAVESVLKQSFKDFEIIIIDDGSTDHTSAELEKYRGRILYIRQENSGVSAARNTGIEISRGTWIAFLDSDDEWLPDYLAYQLKGIKNHPRISTHMTNSTNVLLDGKRVNSFHHNNLIAEFHNQEELLLEKPLYHTIKYRLTALQPTVMQRKTLLQAGLFDTSLSIAEDYDLITRMALMGSFRLCRKELVAVHRRREVTQNLTSQIFQNGTYSFQSFAKVHRNLINSNAIILREIRILRKVLSADLRAIGNLMLRSGKGQEARQYFKEALRVHTSAKSIIKYLLSFLPSRIAFDFVVKGREIRP